MNIFDEANRQRHFPLTLRPEIVGSSFTHAQQTDVSLGHPKLGFALRMVAESSEAGPQEIRYVQSFFPVNPSSR